MEKFFSDKNIIDDILEEIEKEKNKIIDDIFQNIYNDALTDNQLKELTESYSLALLDGYTKDRGRKFDVLDREGLCCLIRFIYEDRTKTVVGMALKRLGFNALTALSLENKTRLKKELKKM